MNSKREIENLLREAHNQLDNINSSDYDMGYKKKCFLCNAESYDGTGIIHDKECLLFRIRQVISV